MRSSAPWGMLCALMTLSGCGMQNNVRIGEYTMNRETYNRLIQEGIGEGRPTYERMTLFGEEADRNKDRYLTQEETTKALRELAARGK